ncbi:MAG: response regulator [Candidatus Riflebacteria bacterium]|nr:response regulator [Candidatus Riflebacteria bacterium]
MTTPLRALVVEGAPEEVSTLIHGLIRIGYEPIHEVVETLGQMRSALARASWDVVLAVGPEPRFDGLAALNELQERGLDVPFIVVSSSLSEETAAAAIRAGARDCIEIGQLARLESTLDRELREARLRRERSHTLDALRESERMLNRAQEIARIGSFELDLETGRFEWSRQMYALLEIDPTEFDGSMEAAFRSVHPQDLPALRAALGRVIEIGRLAPIEYRVVIPEARDRVVWTEGEVIRDKDGYTRRLIGFAQDVTERRRAEHERQITLARLEATNVLLQSLVASVPLNLKLANITASIVRAFEADFCRIWLIRPGDLCDRGCVHAAVTEGPHVCVHRDRCLHLVASAGRYTHTDGEVHGRVPFDCYKIGRIASGKDHRFLTNDVQTEPRVHDHRWARDLGLVSFAGYRLSVPDGRTMGVLALFAKHPITSADDAMLDGLSSTVALVAQKALAEEARDRFEEQLRMSQKMDAIGRLAGGVAHDFNNILTVIQGFGELVLAELGLDHPSIEDVREIIAASWRAASLTRQLLMFSRRQVVEPKVLDLNAAVRDMEKMVRRLIGEDIEVHTRLDSSLKRVHADPGLIEQVLLNLAVNARDAMPGGGLLTIETDNVVVQKGDLALMPEGRVGWFCRLAVSDTGTGIPAKVLPQIFEPFFTTKGAGKGTGLGLAVIHGIVKQHGGWIAVTSRSGRGSTFTIHLPACVSGEVEAPALAVTSRVGGLKGKGERLLIVEDENSLRRWLGRALGAEGYRVCLVGTAANAIEMFEREPAAFDLLFTDVTLPDQNGLSLYDHLWKTSPGLRVLFSSGYSDEKSEWELIRERGLPFLQKPYGASTLLSKLQELLVRPSA